MRKAYHNNFFLVEGSTFYGVSLGWDFCAEHEWGIKKMKQKFGIEEKEFGIPGKTITKSEIYISSDGNSTVLTSRKPYNETGAEPSHDKFSHREFFLDRDIETAWDEEDFCIATNNPANFDFLNELYSAFRENDVAITFLKSEVPAFTNSALVLLIASKVPEEVNQELIRSQKEISALYEYEEEIGMKKLKEEKRGSYGQEKYFMACSPKWIDYENEENRKMKKFKMATDYDIMYWVNYSDDDDNYGWYTVEQIKKWLETPGLKLKSLN